MSDRTRHEKTFAQDAVGFLLILLGGFGAVSIVLFLRGQQPAEGAIRGATWPVVELVTLLGSPAALVFCASLAGLGTLLFLRSTVLAPMRPIAGLLAAALGLALILGAIESGGEVGAWLPGLLAGFAGRALGAVLGLALVWLGWILLFSTRASHPSSADMVQRLGLSARHDAAAGVSPAEAALLVTEPRVPAHVSTPVPMPTPAPVVRREEARPLRVETVRPFPAPKEAPAAAPRARKSEPSSLPLATPMRTPAPPAAAPLASDEAAVGFAIPPAPSWELAGGGADEEDEDAADEGVRGSLPLVDLAPRMGEREEADEDAGLDGELEASEEPESDGKAATGSFETLAEDLAEEFEVEEVTVASLLSAPDAEDEEVLADEDEDEDENEADEQPSASSADAPRAAWEQVGLFDEEGADEEEAEEAAPAKAKAALTPSFDFDSAEPRKPAHEPESSEDPFALEPALVESAELLRELREVDAQQEPHEEEELAEEPQEAVESDASPAERPVELAPARPAPKAAAAPAPVLQAVPAAESVVRAPVQRPWEETVFEAGLAILEQKRVAVSMLERRFGIDFDQACRVLDELQEAGLIGPYMGGRTRDILLTREEWMAHAPHAS
jgi:hypothetical protein